MSAPVLPSFADLLAAAARIAPHAHVTPLLRSRTLGANTSVSTTAAMSQLGARITGAPTTWPITQPLVRGADGRGVLICPA